MTFNGGVRDRENREKEKVSGVCAHVNSTQKKKSSIAEARSNLLVGRFTKAPLASFTHRRKVQPQSTRSLRLRIYVQSIAKILSM